jgi:hypothetical protein
VPSKRVPEVVKRLTERFAKERQGNESFADFANRIGKKTIRRWSRSCRRSRPTTRTRATTATGATRASTRSPTWARASARARWFPFVEVELASAERELFESQVLPGREEDRRRRRARFSAMLIAARALTREKNLKSGQRAGRDRREFPQALLRDEAVWTTSPGGKFAAYFFRAHGRARQDVRAWRRATSYEEATLFVDAAHPSAIRVSAPALRNPTVTLP